MRPYSTSATINPRKYLFTCLLFMLTAISGSAYAAPLETCPGGGFGTAITDQLEDEDGTDRDDGSFHVPSAQILPVFPAGIPFLSTFTDFYINANGNLSFGDPISAFDPSAIPGLSTPAIAPFFGDVDLRSDQGDIYLCIDPAQQRVLVTWDEVGYFSRKTNKLNSFQVILRNNNEDCTDASNFEIELRYEQLEWTTGDASGGNNGLGGSRAVAGIDSGDEINAVALPGSGMGAVLSLTSQTNVGEQGVFRFTVAEGTLPSCGNGTTQLCEECDDNNSSNNDGCTNACKANVCGDGMVYEGTEICDITEFDNPVVCPGGFTGTPLCNNDPANPNGDGTCTVDVVPDGCIDIDECTLDTDNCDTNAACTNTPGTFACTCNSGYMGDGVTCTDIDECANETDNCDTNAACTNTPGTFECVCNPGFTGDGTTCTDIDECANETDNCDTNAACTNTPGTFECACNAGYTGNGETCADIDECMLDTDDCDTNAACTNSPGTFECTCNPGYTGDGTTCVDVDECMLETDNCDANAACTNTVGNFECACNSGYTGNGVMCTDIDECANETDNCDTNAACTNIPGTFECACNPGFMGDGTMCTDIDECANETDNCDTNAACTNTVGNFECTCNSGYMGDGVTCTDIDECVNETDNCDTNATCTNTPGTFECACNVGYTGDGTMCINALDCATGQVMCDTNATCTPQDSGSFCVCNAGYTGDGSMCADIDECTIETDNCDTNATCTNTPGTFECACDLGYMGDGSMCADIDECTIETDNCDTNATCTNTVGSFECACNAGYMGDGVVCPDIDECTIETDNCDTNANCTNTPGSFECLCLPGFSGDGVECLETCGDGELDDNETCDPGIDDPDAPGYAEECRTTCTSCGDGRIQANNDETCDDANTSDGDGCDTSCIPEPQWICDDGEPTTCVPDFDSDTIADDNDNCPELPNTDQADSNNNGIGDACEEPTTPDTSPDVTPDVAPDVTPDTTVEDASEPLIDTEPANTYIQGNSCKCASVQRPPQTPHTPMAISALFLLLGLVFVRRR